MSAHAPKSVPIARGAEARSASNLEPMCGQCGHINGIDRVYCQECGSLLPDADPEPSHVFANSDRTVKKGSKRAWFRVVIAIVLAVSAVATVGLAIMRATEPEPEEQLADQSSHRALAIFDSMNESQTLGQVREISTAGTNALAPIVEMLPRLSSDNDTRSRLDAYRSLFRGMASLNHLEESRLLEWGKTRQLISSSLRELAVDDPMTGALTSQGHIAMDSIQDQVDEIERARGVRGQQRTVGPEQHLPLVSYLRGGINHNWPELAFQFGNWGVLPSYVGGDGTGDCRQAGADQTMPATSFTAAQWHEDVTGGAQHDYYDNVIQWERRLENPSQAQLHSPRQRPPLASDQRQEHALA